MLRIVDSNRINDAKIMAVTMMVAMAGIIVGILAVFHIWSSKADRWSRRLCPSSRAEKSPRVLARSL